MLGELAPAARRAGCPASTIAVRSPGSCSSTRSSRAVESTTSPPVALDRDACRRPPSTSAASSTVAGSETLGKPGPLQRVRAVRARDLAAQPRRREDLARVREPVGVEARVRRRRIASRSRSPKSFGIEHALSTPTPCSPVIEPPGVDAGVEDRRREPLGPLGLALDALVVEDERVQVAVAGVEDVRRRAGRTRSRARRCGAAPRAACVRGTTPSWT